MGTLGRIIGIQHRCKKTSKQEARPTKVHILDPNSKPVTYNLDNDDAELDFVLGRFPIEFRATTAEDDLKKFLPHHIVWEKVDTKAGEKESDFPANLVRKVGRTHERAVKVPVTFDGLRAEDRVAMILGGSGDRFAYALTNRGKRVGSLVFRIPPFKLKEE